jgi:hypothetical protein
VAGGLDEVLSVVAGDAEELPTRFKDSSATSVAAVFSPANCVRASNTDDIAATKSGMAPGRRGRHLAALPRGVREMAVGAEQKRGAVRSRRRWRGRGANG